MSYIINRDVPTGSALDLLGSLRDVNISNPANGDTIVYNATTGKWENSDDCQNYTRLFSLASNNAWADVTVNDIAQYKQLVFCLTRQAAGGANISLTNPVSVSVKFFKNVLNNGSNYLHIYIIKQDTNQLCEAAIYYVNDTTVKFYGAGPWNWELYGVK